MLAYEDGADTVTASMGGVVGGVKVYSCIFPSRQK